MLYCYYQRKVIFRKADKEFAKRVDKILKKKYYQIIKENAKSRIVMHEKKFQANKFYMKSVFKSLTSAVKFKQARQAEFEKFANKSRKSIKRKVMNQLIRTTNLGQIRCNIESKVDMKLRKMAWISLKSY